MIKIDYSLEVEQAIKKQRSSRCFRKYYNNPWYALAGKSEHCQSC